MDTAGIRALAAFLDRRVPLNRLFGPNREDCVKSMILASGGHVRDVLYLMQEVISWALKQNPYGGEQTVQLPLGPDSVVRSIKVHANRYPFLSVEMKETLRQVSRMGSLDSIADALIPFQIQALDHFMILNYHNHRQFFDIHPLIRERIEGDHA